MRKLKHIKYRFLIFLKQFQQDEMRILMDFLELVVDEYNKNPIKLIDLLNYHNDSDIEAEETNNNNKLPKIIKAESLSQLTPPLSLSSSSDLIIDNYNNTSETINNKNSIQNKSNSEIKIYFSKKTSRIPSAFSYKQQQQQQGKSNNNQYDLINDRDDDEKAAINALAKLSNSFNNEEKTTIEGNNNNNSKCQRSNYSRISSIRVNQMLLNDSEYEDDDNCNSEDNENDDDDNDDEDYDINRDIDNDDYDSDYATHSNNTNYDFLKYNSLSGAMTDDDDDNDYDGYNSYDSYNRNNFNYYDDDHVIKINGNNNNKNKTILNDSIRNSNGRIRKFSERIRMELEKYFQKNRYISGEEKKMLADKLNLTVRQVQKWFVHRREKFRRFEKHYGKKSSNINYKNHKNQQQIKEEKIDFDNDVDNDGNDNDDVENDDFIKTLESNETSVNENHGLKFTPYIENYLEKLFRKKPQLTQRDLNSACLNLNLKQKQIKVWFQFRRQKQQQQTQQFKNYTNKTTKTNKILNGYNENINDFDLNNSGSNNDLNKRQNYPEHVLRQLENAFLRNRYISGNEKRSLSKKLGLAPIQIERWFYTRRKNQI